MGLNSRQRQQSNRAEQRTQSHIGEQAKRSKPGKGKKRITELEKALEPLAELGMDDSTTHAEKIMRAEALHTKWKEEDSLRT